MTEIIIHDGHGVPVNRGTKVDALFYYQGWYRNLIVGANGGDSWTWSLLPDGTPECLTPDADPIIAYVTRSFSAMEDLRQIARDVEENTPVYEDQE